LFLFLLLLLLLLGDHFKKVLRPVHTDDKLSPFRATIVAVFGVAANGDYSFGDNFSPVWTGLKAPLLQIGSG